MSERLLLRGARVFDGERPLGVRDVLVTGGRVAQVGERLTAWDRVVDCSGGTLLPGLIDAHVHIAWAGLDPPPASVEQSYARAVANAGELLAAGVTTVRDTGGPLEVLSRLAGDLGSGAVAGPELRHCGRILCAPGGHGTEIPLPVPIAQECSGPAEFRDAVREQVAGGAQWVKVTLNGGSGAVELAAGELAGAVDAAREAGIRVACHASVRAAVELAVRCGVDTIEHGNGLDVGLATQLAAAGGALVPTVTIFCELAQQLAAAPGENSWVTTEAVRQRVREHPPAIAAASAAGVPIGFGTDRVPGGSVAAVREEALALAAAGLPAQSVLRAATSVNADLLGLPDRGRIRPGARADLVLFAGDVLADLGRLERPLLVLQGGEVVAGEGAPR